MLFQDTNEVAETERPGCKCEPPWESHRSYYRVPCQLPPSWSWFPTINPKTWDEGIVAAPVNGSLVHPYRGPFRIHDQLAAKKRTGELLRFDFLEPEEACHYIARPAPWRQVYWAENSHRYTFNPANCELPEAVRWITHEGYVISTFVEEIDPPTSLQKVDSLKIATPLANSWRVSVEDACPYWRDVCGSANPPDLPEKYKNCTPDVGQRWLHVIDPEDGRGTWLIAPQGGPLCRAFSPYDAYVRLAKLDKGTTEEGKAPLFYVCPGKTGSLENQGGWDTTFQMPGGVWHNPR